MDKRDKEPLKKLYNADPSPRDVGLVDENFHPVSPLNWHFAHLAKDVRIRLCMPKHDVKQYKGCVIFVGTGQLTEFYRHSVLGQATLGLSHFGGVFEDDITNMHTCTAEKATL